MSKIFKDIGYLLAGIYTKQKACYAFEDLCALLLCEENKGKGWLYIENTTNDICLKKINLNEKIYKVSVKRGDGGLDIIWEVNNCWWIYQCKFILESSNLNKRRTDIQNSFERSCATADKFGKKICKWILCLPLDFDNDARAFWNRFITYNIEKEIQMETILNTDLNVMLSNFPHIDQYIFDKQHISKTKLILEFDKFISEVNFLISMSESPESINRRKSLVECHNEYANIISEIPLLERRLFREIDEMKKIDAFYSYLHDEYQEYYKEKQYWSSNKVSIVGERLNKKSNELLELIHSLEEYKNFLVKLKSDIYELI